MPQRDTYNIQHGAFRDEWTDGMRVGPEHPAAYWIFNDDYKSFWEKYPNGLMIREYIPGINDDEYLAWQGTDGGDVYWIESYNKAEDTSKKVNKSSDSSTNADPGVVTDLTKAKDKTVRVQVDPDTNTKIPVLYGRGVCSGKIVDVELQNNNILWIAMTLCLTTGNKINGDPSSYTVKNVYMNDMRLEFNSTGVTVNNAVDTEGNNISDFNDKVGVLMFNTSALQLEVTGFPLPVGLDARNIFPNWTPNHRMSGQLFAVVGLTYDDDIGLDTIPDFKFDIENDMSLPGDCLYDFLTNTVYGCGLNSDNIKVS